MYIYCRTKYLLFLQHDYICITTIYECGFTRIYNAGGLVIIRRVVTIYAAWLGKAQSYDGPRWELLPYTWSMVMNENRVKCKYGLDDK
jgi:hypothetical protein